MCVCRRKGLCCGQDSKYVRKHRRHTGVLQIGMHATKLDVHVRASEGARATLIVREVNGTCDEVDY